MDAISKITFSIGGYFGDYRSYIVELTDELKAYTKLWEDEEPLALLDTDNKEPFTKDTFIAALKDLHIGVWRRRYSTKRFGYMNFVDVIVYDALACNSEWINACIDAKIDTVVRVKKNNINSIKEVKYRVNKLEPDEIWQNYEGYKSVEVYEGYFKMNNVNPELRFIKFHQRKQNNNEPR